jgi:hypothetical protein
MGKRKKNLWIQDALKGHTPGATHRQLGVPLDKKIPKTFLTKIKNTEIGKTIQNPTKTGKRRIKITRLLKQRAVLAHTLRSF